MGNLSAASRLRIASPVLLALVTACILVPLLFFVADSLWRFESASLSPDFFRLLAHAVIFGGLQAVASAAFSLLTALALALGLLSLKAASRPCFENALRCLGQILFVLPGTSISLLVLSLPSAARDPLEGWPLIVFAHVLWSAPFIASHISDRFSEWLETEGADLLRAAKHLGASPASAFRSIAWPVLRPEASTWFPLICLWSFGAFSTVLLLGSGPRESTPDVLLYYTLFNDTEPSRLFVVFAATLVLQSLLLMFFNRRGLMSRGEARLGSPASAGLRGQRRERVDLPASAALRIFGMLFASLAVGLIAWQLWAVASRGLPDPLIWKGLAFSWILALTASAFCAVLLLLAAASSPRALSCLVLILALSPIVLATSWSRIPVLSPFTLSSTAAWCLCGLGLALLQLPFASLWIKRSLAAMNPDLVVYARSAGLSPEQVFWKIRIPYLAPVFEKVLASVFCAALGEIALVSVWLRDWPLLSLSAKRLTQSYDFRGTAWIFVFTIASALLARSVFAFVLKRGAR